MRAAELPTPDFLASLRIGMWVLEDCGRQLASASSRDFTSCSACDSFPRCLSSVRFRLIVERVSEEKRVGLVLDGEGEKMALPLPLFKLGAMKGKGGEYSQLEE